MPDRMPSRSQEGERPRDGYECVDPGLAEDLWRLDDPGTDSAVREELRLHLEYCDACRLERAAARRLRPPRGRRRSRIRVLQGVGALLAAASLASILFLPPPAPPRETTRGAIEPAFVRPVRGEVVPEGPVTLRWTPIEGATRYEVRVEEVGTDRSWEQSSRTPSLDFEGPWTRGAEYRAILSTVPSDLLAPGETGIHFEVGARAAVWSYRVAHARPMAWATLVLGLFALLLVPRLGRPAASP